MNDASEEMRFYVRYNELYDVIHEADIATGHGGRNRIIYAVNSNYENINIEAINMYLKLCEPCKKKKKYAQKRVLPLNLLYMMKLNRASK